jgi:hypothetical protein
MGEHAAELRAVKTKAPPPLKAAEPARAVTVRVPACTLSLRQNTRGEHAAELREERTKRLLFFVLKNAMRVRACTCTHVK